MRILTHNPEPLQRIGYHNASSAGKPEYVRLPVTTGTISGKFAGLSALVLTADLQGRERVYNLPIGQEPPLLGETVAHDLERLGASAMLPPADEVGVILAGDFWADPNSRRRGGLGDVAPVWNAFARSFRWVAGVLGNHDKLHRTQFANQDLLDGETVERDGLRIGGVGGIVGVKGKPGRKPADDFLIQLHEVMERRPDLVILHMGPDSPETGLLGNEAVRETIEEYPPTLVVCGHVHTEEPIHQLGNGTQVVNVDSRTIIMKFSQ